MKFSITISDAAPADLARILTLIDGQTPVLMQRQPVLTAAASDGDDEATDIEAPAGTVDADGVPHDARIHSSPAKLTGKGVWRKKRGVTDGEVAAVEAELKAARAAPAPAPVMTMQPAPVAPAPVMAAPVPAPVMTMQPAPVMAAPAPVPAPAPVMTMQPAPVAPVSVTAVPNDFQSFMTGVQQVVASGKANADYFTSLVQRVNQALGTAYGTITDFDKLGPEHIAWVWQIMQTDGVA